MECLRRWVDRAMVLVAVATLVGLVVFWPRGDAPDLGLGGLDYVDATVTSVVTSSCRSIEVPDAMSGCREVGTRLTSGAAEGRTATITVYDTQFEVPDLAVGDPIVLLDAGARAGEFRYSYSDFQRSFPMWVLAVAFVAVVVAFGRWRGLRALVGLGTSALVLVVFIVPALLRGSPAVPVALVGSALVAFLALYLSHGVNPPTTVALAGTLVSLVVIALLSLLVTEVAHLSGLADEAAQSLRVTAGQVDLRSLLIAGFVLGALGVLDDVTVTQVSTVQALLRADPTMPRRELYREATEVGRDHIASTVNTLVLAYAGAALPLMLFFAEGAAPVGRLITRELVAVEIIRMLVGSIGLVVSVPVTTALAAAVIRPGSADVGHDHGHAHGHAHGRAPDRDDGPARWEDFGPQGVDLDL